MKRQKEELSQDQAYFSQELETAKTENQGLVDRCTDLVLRLESVQESKETQTEEDFQGQIKALMKEKESLEEDLENVKIQNFTVIRDMQVSGLEDQVQVQKVSEELAQKLFEIFMTNPGFYGIKICILKNLEYQDRETLCKIWPRDEQLQRNTWTKFMKTFGEKKIKIQEVQGTVRTHIPGWDAAVQLVGTYWKIEDLRGIKEEIYQCLAQRAWINEFPVHVMAREGQYKTLKFIFKTSYDFQSQDQYGRTPLQCALRRGHWELVEEYDRWKKAQNIT